MGDEGSQNEGEGPEHTPTLFDNNLYSDVSAIHRIQCQLSSTHNSLSSLASCEEGLAGARRNGQMSVVRRFFCLFVVFDVLLIGLIWLICLMLMGGNNLVQILKMQIVYYKISNSLFDLVLAAFCRFTILLLFYGLLYLNTTFFVAFTTLGTCIFIIVKVVYYSWSSANQPEFPVILVLISFIISWTESWFLDFRVLPQERFAFNYALSSGRFSESLSTLLLDPNLRSPVLRHFLHTMTLEGRSESNESFHTPVDNSDHSENELIDQRVSEKIPDIEYLRRGKNTLEIAWGILNDRDWKLQKMSSDGDCVYSKHEAHLGKIFLLRAKVNMEAQKLLEELFLHVDNFTMWNKTVLESKRVRVIDEHTDITYQVSSPGGNGVISSRDFVTLRHWDIKGDSYVLAGISIPYSKLPPSKNYIRGENGPCCWVMRPCGENYESCVFEFLLNTNLKGWIPQYVVDSAFTSVLIKYSACLKEHCKSIQKLENT